MIRCTAIAALLFLLISCETQEPWPPPPQPEPEPPCTDTVLVSALVLSPTATAHAWEASFTSTAPAACWLEYGPLGSAEVLRSAASPGGQQHQLWMGLLMPQTSYWVRAVTGSGDCRREGPTDTLTTTATSASLPALVTTPAGSTAPFTGYLLMNKNLIPGCVQLVNAQGATVWYHCFNRPVATFSFTPRGTVLCIIGDDEIAEVDLQGNLITDLHLGSGGFQKPVHHEVWMDEAGNIIALCEQRDTADFTAWGGSAAQEVVSDGILILDAAGQSLWEWNVFDWADPATDSAAAAVPGDWLHANAVQPTADGHFIICFRNSSQIWKINRNTGAVMWKLGAGGDFALPAQAAFYRQHFAMETSPGSLLFFDNGQNPERPTSRALELQLDEAAMTATIAADVPLPADWFSSKMGSVMKLPGDLYLFGSSETQRIGITDGSGNLLWQAQWSYLPYRVVWVPSMAAKLQ